MVFGSRKLEYVHCCWCCPMFSHFDRTPTCDRRTNAGTDGRTDWRTQSYSKSASTQRLAAETDTRPPDRLSHHHHPDRWRSLYVYGTMHSWRFGHISGLSPCNCDMTHWTWNSVRKSYVPR